MILCVKFLSGYAPARTNWANSASNCTNSSEPSTSLNSISPHLSMSETFFLPSISKFQISLCICLIVSSPESPYLSIMSRSFSLALRKSPFSAAMSTSLTSVGSATDASE